MVKYDLSAFGDMLMKRKHNSDCATNSNISENAKSISKILIDQTVFV
jgi:hypothetical protein